MFTYVYSIVVHTNCRCFILSLCNFQVTEIHQVTRGACSDTQRCKTSATDCRSNFSCISYCFQTQTLFLIFQPTIGSLPRPLTLPWIHTRLQDVSHEKATAELKIQEAKGEVKKHIVSCYQLYCMLQWCEGSLYLFYS